MRPEGYKNPHKPKMVIGIEDRLYTINDLYREHEAGADAYEEALKRAGEYVEDSYEPIELCEHKSGWWVFIEDDDVAN